MATAPRGKKFAGSRKHGQHAEVLWRLVAIWDALRSGSLLGAADRLFPCHP